MHSKIIRDADKIDILYAFSTNTLIKIDEEDEDISEMVKENFFKHTPSLRENIKNNNDRIVMFIGFIFDLNYEYSKERVLDEKYLNKIYDNLKNKKRFKPYIDEAIKYLKGKK